MVFRPIGVRLSAFRRRNKDIKQYQSHAAHRCRSAIKIILIEECRALEAQWLIRIAICYYKVSTRSGLVAVENSLG